MSKEIKPIVSKAETFDQLDIRLGKVISVDIESTAPKKSYKIKVDFGKFGVRTTVGRFTQHTPEEMIGQLVMGILNLGEMQMGDVTSEFLLLGVQYPKADSGEATFISPAANAKIGGKLF